MSWKAGGAGVSGSRRGAFSWESTARTPGSASAASASTDATRPAARSRGRPVARSATGRLRLVDQGADQQVARERDLERVAGERARGGELDVGRAAEGLLGGRSAPERGLRAAGPPGRVGDAAE